MKSWCALLGAAVALLSSDIARAAPPTAPSAPLPSELPSQTPGNPVSQPTPGTVAPGAGASERPPASAGTRETPNETTKGTSQSTHRQSPKRAVPDYSGRGPQPTTAGEVVLWIPRVILSPLYALNEFVFRQPLSVVVPPIERANLPRKIYDFFCFTADHKACILPVGFLDFNSLPTLGIAALWRDALFSGNNLNLRVEGWPTDVFVASASERIHLSKGRTLTLKVVGYDRPDHMFFGLGPSSTEDHRSRYRAQSVDGSISFGKVFWRATRIDTTVGVRDVRTYNGHFGSDPSLQAEADTGAFAVPYGFEEQYSLAYSRLRAILDNRRPYPFDGSGVRLEAEVEQDSAWNPEPGSEWIKYGATLGGYWDINGYRRVLSLTVTALFVDPIDSTSVPFTELVALGGDGPMRGFYPGRLLDRSAAVATLRYTWPVGPWIDASLTFATGNVFGAHLDEFQAGLLRLSGTVGLVLTPPMSGYPIELLVGAGTETFDDGAHLNTVRASFGVSRF